MPPIDLSSRNIAHIPVTIRQTTEHLHARSYQTSTA